MKNTARPYFLIQHLAPFLAIILFGTSAVNANAALMLDTADTVARGDAFQATARSDRPVSRFIFEWLGKEYSIKAVPSLATGMPQSWQASILLPVPLDENKKFQNISVRADYTNTSQEKGRSGPEQATARVSIIDRYRPVQKLTVEKKYVNPPASAQKKIGEDRQKVASALAQPLDHAYWKIPFVRPVSGDTSSLFGMKRIFNGQPRSVHRGLDLRGKTGTPIRACADGRVELVDNLYYSGNAVYLNRPAVEKGAFVKKGDIIGYVGATGRVTGPHLHLSMIVQGHSVDPQPFLEKHESPTK